MTTPFETQGGPEIYLTQHTYAHVLQQGVGRIACNPELLGAVGNHVAREGGRNLPGTPAELAIVLWMYGVRKRNRHFAKMGPYETVYNADHLPRPWTADDIIAMRDPAKQEILDRGRKPL